MSDKKYTVIFLPSDSSNARKFGVRRNTLWISGLSLIALFLLSIVLIQDRFVLENKLAHLSPLESQASAHKKVIERFGKRIQELDFTLAKLKKMEDQLRIMASVKPREKNGTVGLGGISKDDLPEKLDGLGRTERLYVNRLNRQFLDLEQRASDQARGFGELVSVFKEKRSLLAHTPSILPTRGWFTSGFGRRISPFTARKEFHSGIDLVARPGTPVHAPADGLVIKAKRESGYGNLLEIRHMQGIVTRFAHLQKFIVRPGTRVKRGDVIAKVGSTGRSTGPHLHYEVRLNGVAVNPLLYIVDAQVARR
jgi:murein DD-endopeptidase MepM/ murein hydrolase activator NlpD